MAYTEWPTDLHISQYNLNALYIKKNKVGIVEKIVPFKPSF